MGHVGSHLWQIREGGWGNKLLLIPGVNAMVVNGKGQILLGFRNDLQGGCWASPGGAAEPHQSVMDALRAEMREELGQEVASATFFGVLSDPAKTLHTYSNGDILQPVSSLFEVMLAGEPALADDEHSELRWFGLDEIPAREQLLAETDAIITMYKTWRATGLPQID